MCKRKFENGVRGAEGENRRMIVPKEANEKERNKLKKRIKKSITETRSPYVPLNELGLPISTLKNTRSQILFSKNSTQGQFQCPIVCSTGIMFGLRNRFIVMFGYFKG